MSGRPRPRRRELTPVVVSLVVLGSAGVALAAFSGATSAGHTLSSATLEPASNLTASTSCGPLLSVTAEATLTWAASPSGFATGHKVERWLGAALQSTTLVTPRTTTTLTESALSVATTYTWKVYAYAQGWTSSPVTVSATTPLLCT